MHHGARVYYVFPERYARDEEKRDFTVEVSAKSRLYLNFLALNSSG
ncbi:MULTISPECIES: hypothetical protein [unclassified Archaeoglobus]|nr:MULTISPECIES: hypothetical protein [unclassified Archaeoglobus]